MLIRNPEGLIRYRLKFVDLNRTEFKMSIRPIELEVEFSENSSAEVLLEREFATVPFWSCAISLERFSTGDPRLRCTQLGDMKTHQSNRISALTAGLILMAFMVTLSIPPASVLAQSPCPGGSDADALGCVGEQQSPLRADNSPSTLTVEERTQTDIPSADRSTEASARNSLSNGSTFSETPRGKLPRGSRAQSLPVEPPTEFQTFVNASIGQALPIFGARFFTTGATSFAPMDHGPVPGSTITGSDDELRIRVWGQVNFSAELRVSREGDIYLPKVGAVHVAGLAFSALSDHIRDALSKVYRNFDVSVDLGEMHSIQVYVTGMARQPGEYTVSALETLVDAVFSVGGPSSAGSMRHVLLKRGGVTITDLDLYRLLVNGDKSGDAQLQTGDVLYFSATGPQVAIAGSVRQPAIYELRETQSIGQILDIAGGRTGVADGGSISIERIDSHTHRIAIAVPNDSAGLSTSLADGDIVRVNPIIPAFVDAVTLRGAVANPGHFRWHEGMRLSELIPERDALLERDYWWRRSRLGMPAPQLLLPGAQEGNEDKSSAFQSPATQTNWNQAVIERLDPSSMTTKLIPFNLGKLVLEHDSSQDLQLTRGDVITIFAQNEIQPPIRERTAYVELDGEFTHPGIYSVSEGDTLRSLATRAGGLTDRAYLYGSIFTRISTQKLEQQQMNAYFDRFGRQLQRVGTNPMVAEGSTGQLTAQQQAAWQANAVNSATLAQIHQMRASGRIVLAVDPQMKDTKAIPEIHLEDGDHFVVPIAPDTVQVVGSVFNPHAFLYQGNSRVSDYLHRAGGPTPTADSRHMLLLRADGSVVERTSKNNMRRVEFNKLTLFPGDAIIVPDKIAHPSVLGQFMTWTQLMSEASIASIAMESLK